MHRNEKGFTLMELMVVIVIVAILAAVAVPLYINYVKDAQRTDAKAAIGAIITAQQSYFLKSQTGTPTFAEDMKALVGAGVLDQAFQADVQKRWTITFPKGGTDGFSVSATSISDNSVVVTYDYTQTGGGTWDAPPPD
jgi:prepilin-type N-terminal cleavage/methylation domain-containing protein